MGADLIASFSAQSSEEKPVSIEAGARIVNSSGVPGTLGCLARTLHDGRFVLLTTCHVLFGNGGQEDDEVRLVAESNGSLSLIPVGRTLYGKAGTIPYAGRDYYVDCAVASYLVAMQHRPGSISTTRQRHGTAEAVQTCRPTAPTTGWSPVPTGVARAERSCLVTKTGVATATTSGVVIDIDYCDSVVIDGRLRTAPGQILVRPAGDAPVFSAEGDSGALLLDSLDRAVGLLWGSTSRGEGVACHIGPVLHAMNITLDTLFASRGGALS